MEDYEIYALVVRVISSCNLVIYIAAFILIGREKNKKNLSSLINLQLAITCFIHSISYLLPPTKPFFCPFQSMLNTFGELSKLTIATTILLLAQLNFIKTNELEQKKKMYFGISILISGVLPITIGIISVLSGDVNDYSSFCWIKSSTVLFIFIIIRFIIVIVFFILAGKLIFHMKEESKTGNMVDEIYILIKERITRYVYLITYNTIVFVYYSSFRYL